MLTRAEQHLLSLSRSTYIGQAHGRPTSPKPKQKRAHPALHVPSRILPSQRSVLSYHPPLTKARQLPSLLVFISPSTQHAYTCYPSIRIIQHPPLKTPHFVLNLQVFLRTFLYLYTAVQIKPVSVLVFLKRVLPCVALPIPPLSPIKRKYENNQKPPYPTSRTLLPPPGDGSLKKNNRSQRVRRWYQLTSFSIIDIDCRHPKKKGFDARHQEDRPTNKRLHSSPFLYTQTFTPPS